MSEPAPPADTERDVDRPRSLSRETLAAALDDLGGWLDGLIDMPVAADSSNLPGGGVDLHTLLAHFTGLRQEINLQTKALRTQQEQTNESLRHAALALKTLETSQAVQRQTDQAAAEILVRPFLQTLMELHDALTRTGREVQRALDAFGSAPTSETSTSALGRVPGPEEVPMPPPPSRWARWLGVHGTDPTALDSLRSRLAAWQRQQAAMERLAENGERARQILASVVAGYGMTLQRVERAMSKHGLESIAAVGESYDPERMEAVEAVANSGLPSGQVVDEVRRGYLFQGRVLRFAQVRVAKN